MPREKRAYLPGAFFHLTARTQGHVHWFTDDIKTRMVGFMADAVLESDVELVAFVVMSNHLHAIARQHAVPLAGFMQPLLRRCALLVKRSFGVQGHVFERRFRHKVCADASHLRSAIRYVHRNPFEAGLCSSPGDYPWSSDRSYRRPDLRDARGRPRMLILRDLFAIAAGQTLAESCLDYERFLETDSTSAEAREYGDQVWCQLHTPDRVSATHVVRQRADLRDVVLAEMASISPDLDIEMVRTFRGSLMSSARRRIVERAAREGYRGCEIARYLHMSEARVSRIVRGVLRRQSAPTQ